MCLNIKTSLKVLLNKFTFRNEQHFFWHIPVLEISFLSYKTDFLFEEKGELLTKRKIMFEVSYMLEEIFNEILDSQDGDYVVIAKVLVDMKPNGW